MKLTAFVYGIALPALIGGLSGWLLVQWAKTW